MTTWSTPSAPASTWEPSAAAPDSAWEACGPAPASVWNPCGGGGTPTQYTVTRSSPSATVGATVTITAQLADVNGDPVRQAGHLVTWSKTGAGGSFAAATSETDDDGIATVVFTVGTVADTSHTVTATDEIDRTGTSGAIVTVAGPAASMEFTTAPAGAVGDVALTTQPVLRLLDSFGNLATGSAVTVSASVDVGSLTGAGPIAPVVGVVTFSALAFVDIPLVKAGSRVLTFSAVGVTPLAADPIMVVLGNDHVAWFCADESDNTLDGSAPPHLITAFDRTGHGNSVAATGTILRQLAMLNGKAGFDFSTAGANYVDNLVIGVQGSFTWFGVFKIFAGATYQNLFDCLAVPITWLFWDQPANRWQVGDRLAGSSGVAGSYVTLVVHYINLGAQVQVVVRANGVTLLNSFLTAPGALIPGSAGSPANKTFPQFQRPPETFTFKSHMLEWGFYSRSKNGAEAGLESYLRSEYATW